MICLKSSYINNADHLSIFRTYYGVGLFLGSIWSILIVISIIIGLTRALMAVNRSRLSFKLEQNFLCFAMISGRSRAFELKSPLRVNPGRVDIWHLNGDHKGTSIISYRSIHPSDQMSVAEGIAHMSYYDYPDICYKSSGGRYSGVTNHSLKPFRIGVTLLWTVSDPTFRDYMMAECPHSLIVTSPPSSNRLARLILLLIILPVTAFSCLQTSRTNTLID